jgi:phage gpG-like protein
MKAKKFNMKGLDKKLTKAFEGSLVLIGNEAKNHFVDNFRKQGFEDKTVKAWMHRKKEDKRSGRNILVRTGDLRRSIQAKKINRSGLSLVIASDLVYASVHNDGGMIYRRAHKRKGGNISSSQFKMPKRQFIGSSYNLNEKVKKILFKRFDSVFKK